MTKSLDLPPPIETADAVMEDGAVIRLRRYGNAAGARLILCHGNGFATDAYYPFWRHLLGDYDLVIHDLRNHGQNPFHGSIGHNLHRFALDHEALRGAVSEHFGTKPTAGIFHSVSSLAAIVQTVTRGLVWDALVLVDPPLIPSPGHRLRENVFAAEIMLANWAMQRPDRFSEPGELAAIFRDTRAMSNWTEGTHDLLARGILRPEDGEWVLACPRELEASVYAENAHSTIWSMLPDLKPFADRIGFMSADPDLEGAKPHAAIGRAVHDEFGYLTETVSGTGHMLQVERPQSCAETVRRLLAQMSFGPAS